MPPEGPVPSLIWSSPFAALLLCTAVLPLIHRTEHWWNRNRNKLVAAVGLGAVTLLYYQFRGYGIRHDGAMTAPGAATSLHVLRFAILAEYVPFISLLFSLYVIAGGIHVKGDIPAHPLTNTLFLAVGAVLTSAIGTTGASMLLIRPLLNTNSERRHVSHTVIFFIFIVSNIGGTLLPIGDPPLFLGYLRGVPFLWTLALWRPWLFMVGALLVTYYFWDRAAYTKETPWQIRLDETRVEKLRILGAINILWLLAVVLATGTLDPIRPFIGTDWKPPPYLREMIQLAFVGLSLSTTPKTIRRAHHFTYGPIIEVAFLFAGIFLCMQVPIEILDARGPRLGLDSPTNFFWASGLLSSFLDNVPTYAVFFEAANSLTHTKGPGVVALLNGQHVREDLLAAVSLGAVFMGANTYIGNGPNFMVKSIAQHAGVKMPSFFGYMIYSVCILVPLFILVNVIFLR